MKTIAIVFGGFSGERVVSEKSARVVANYLPSIKYIPFLIDINREQWFAIVDKEHVPVNKDDFSILINGEKISFDGVFNAIHGTPGEDGIIQGYFDLLKLPYNNCGVLASSLSFNKASCNSFLAGHGIKVAESVHVRLGHPFNVDEIIAKVGLPCFVKPNDGGSSIGVTKVKDKDGIAGAIKLAQSEGVDALIERFLEGTEVSCGCISIDRVPKSIAITEILPANEFFDFDSKYNNKATQEITPARLPKDRYDEIMKMTEYIYQVLDCRGMIRVDFMVCEDASYLIEPNTTPGLSEASILPQQAAYAGYDLSTFFDISLTEMFKSKITVSQEI
ncbi:MAG: D-alanine--D-alanine ligase family protein [Salibacteraceae bacterium]